MRHKLLPLLALIPAAICQNGSPVTQFPVLVFSKTTGFRHSSIPNGVAALRKLGSENSFSVAATEDAAQFNDANLRNYRLVIFLNTTGDILDDAQQGAFERYIAAGGGFLGIHSASDTEYDWPFYGRLVGAYFKSHPAIQPAVIHVTDRSHPSTQALPETWSRTDEWYNFRENPRPAVHVLASLDESSYKGGEMGSDHPISWCQEEGGARAWYTAMGHTEESYTEREFLAHLLGGIRYAAGVDRASCGGVQSRELRGPRITRPGPGRERER